MTDFINACFELLAGFMVFNHCRLVLRDKAVAGVSICSVIFFNAWGYWNLYYYPALDQMLSFFGGILIVLANTYWLFLLVKFRRKAMEVPGNG